MNTKAYIKYKEAKRTWVYASIVLEGVFESCSDIDDYFADYSPYSAISNLIYYHCETGGLDNWVVYDFIKTDEVTSENFTIGEKSENLIKLEKEANDKLKVAQKKARKAKYELNKAKKSHESSKKELEKIKKENNKLVQKKYNISEEEAAYFLTNLEYYSQYYASSFFGISGHQIKDDYKKYLAGEMEIKERERNKPRIDIPSIVEEKDFVGDYVIIMNKKVPAHLIIDYLKHTSNLVIRSYASEQRYEQIRCDLHEKIFLALGGDRIKDHDKEIGGSISIFLSNVSKCCCGGLNDMYGECVDCGKKITFADYKYNLESYIIKN